MGKDFLDYERIVETALRGVVREALRRVARQGLPGGHHFFLTFRTDAPGVVLPEHLRARYPQEMTIVLQHQFWSLEVEEARFRVTLSFNKLPARLEVPFAALTAFADPGVNFGLRFGGGPAAQTTQPAPGGESAPALAPAAEGRAAEGAASPPDKVVTLDQFRRK